MGSAQNEFSGRNCRRARHFARRCGAIRKGGGVEFDRRSTQEKRFIRRKEDMFNKKRLLKYALMPALAGLALAAVAAIAVRPSSTVTGEASSHREAPLISGDPLADATDIYAFISHDASDKLTLVGNWIPFEEPAGGPNFYNFGDDVTYDFDIDNNGDAKTDIVYRFKFQTQVLDPSTFLYATGPIHSLTDSTFNIRQYFDVYRQDGGGAFNLVARHLQTPPNNIGPKSTPNYAATA